MRGVSDVIRRTVRFGVILFIVNAIEDVYLSEIERKDFC